MPSTVLTIPEYGAAAPIIPQLATALRITNAEAEVRLRKIGERLQQLHSLAGNPLEITNEGVVAKEIAGVIAITPRVEIEIRPKFARPDADWRTDLLFLALMTKYGRIDPFAAISSSISSPNGMADLVARVIVRAIERNHRTPLRMRRRIVFESFEPEGEVGADALLNPGADGWQQSRYATSRDNEYWATIYGGSATLLPHMKEIETAARLTSTITRYGRPTTAHSRIWRLLPPRLAAWQTPYNLCFELMRSASLAPSGSGQATFEFTLDMWRAWEALVQRGTVIAFGADKVSLQSPTRLGTTTREGRRNELIVIPDATVAGHPPLVIDAKYKGRTERGPTRVSTSDRYEAIAFMLATGADRAILVYPSVADAHVGTPTEMVQREELPVGELIAVSIGLSGISAPGGMALISDRLKQAVELSSKNSASSARRALS